MTGAKNPVDFSHMRLSRLCELHPAVGCQCSVAPEPPSPWGRCPTQTNRPRTALPDGRFGRIRCHSACRAQHRTDHNPNTPSQGVQAEEGIFWTQSAQSFLVTGDSMTLSPDANHTVDVYQLNYHGVQTNHPYTRGMSNERI